MRAYASERPCAECTQPFQPLHRYADQQLCSRLCANRHMAKRRQAKAQRYRMPCLWCTKPFAPTNRGRKCCSRDCAKKRRVAMNILSHPKGRVTNPGLPRRCQPKHLGAMLIAPQGPPTCPTCGERAYPGSDPYTGVSTLDCNRCGRSIAPRYGAVVHDQRPELEAEMAGGVGRACAPVKPHAGRGRLKDFHVVGRDLQRRIEAA